MENKIPPYLLQTVHDKPVLINVKRAKLSFLDKTLLNSASVIKSIYLQAENAAEDNLVQKINPYAKLISLIYIVVVISLISNPVAQALITAFIILLYIIARQNIFQIYRKIFFVAFIFGFLAVLPASLSVITKGKIILNIITFDKPSHFWIYNIPRNIGITDNGLQVVLLVFLRVLNSVSFALLIVFTTPFSSFIKSLKIIGVPETFMMIISLAYKYIFILSRTIEETYFALKSRLTGNVNSRNIRNLVGGRMFFIFRKSRIIYENTYFAMVSRGYNGEAKLNVRYHFTFADLVYLIIIVSVGIVIIIL
jgi:cobalt/nickel transport system permease protein